MYFVIKLHNFYYLVPKSSKYSSLCLFSSFTLLVIGFAYYLTVCLTNGILLVEIRTLPEL